MELKNKIALITGAAHRVGKAIALRLAQHGAHIVLHYRSSAEAAQHTQAELEALNVQVLPIQADLSDPDAIEAMVSQAIAHFGRIDILVNSAASFEKISLDTMAVADWDRVLNTNLRAPFWCAKTVATHMKALPEAVIINISDLVGVVPVPGMIAHGVAKAALINLTEALALELRPNIRVNAIVPGPVIAPPDYSEKLKNAIAQRTLLKKWGSSDHVARAVQFFVENDYVTGELVRVDGGELLAWRDRQKL